MRTKCNFLILLFFILISCVGKEKQIIIQDKNPFKPALERVITELRDSLKKEIGKNKLLSIEFYFPNSHTDHRNRRGGEMKVFISECYASANIDGYAKIDSTTIAIYNLKDDIFELVNKNEISFFTDTVIGFRDTCVMFVSEKEFFYRIIKEDSITKVPYSLDFLNLLPLRLPRCPLGLPYTPPEEYWFHYDSLQAEENLKYYQKEVKYYRNKRPE